MPLCLAHAVAAFSYLSPPVFAADEVGGIRDTRVIIAAGNQMPVSFEIPVERFRSWDATMMSQVIEPGAYELLGGGASDKLPEKLSSRCVETAPLVKQS